MTRTRLNLFVSLDGYTPSDPTPDQPMGADFPGLTAAWTATRTFHEQMGDSSGKGTTGVDDKYAVEFFLGVGAEVMGAGMFGLHAFPDDAAWTGWWGDRPSFQTPVFVLTHTAPRPSIPMEGGTTFHFRNAPVEDVLAEAKQAAGALDVRVGGGYRAARAFLQAGLIDDLHLMVTPIFLGRGHRLWDDLRGTEQTHAVTTEVAESGIIHVSLTR